MGNSSEIKACKVLVGGRVTGVGFRFFVLDKIENFFTLTGYVRNIGWNEVEVLVQGKPAEVNEILKWIKQGPANARVDSMNVSEVPYNPVYNTFEIR